MDKITGEELAFPVAGPTDKGFADQPGMTLRQYYVGQALAGLCAHNRGKFEHLLSQKNAIEVASKAIQIADMVIEFLNRKQ